MHTLSGNHTESKHPLFEEHISVCTGLPPRGENARSGGGKPISLERRKAGQLHMRLHSWRQASPPSLPLALRSSVLSFASFLLSVVPFDVMCDGQICRLPPPPRMDIAPLAR